MTKQLLMAAAVLAFLSAHANAESGSNRDRGYGGQASAVGNFGSGQGNDRYSIGGTSSTAGLNGPSGTGRGGRGGGGGFGAPGGTPSGVPGFGGGDNR